MWGDLCNCAGHNKQLCYRDEMVGTQMVSGALKKDHQAKILPETASLPSLKHKLNRMCALEKAKLSSAMLSRQIQSATGVKVGETRTSELSKSSPSHKVYKKSAKCQ